MSFLSKKKKKIFKTLTGSSAAGSGSTAENGLVDGAAEVATVLSEVLANAAVVAGTPSPNVESRVAAISSSKLLENLASFPAISNLNELEEHHSQVATSRHLSL